MTKSEHEFILEVCALMARVPQASPNPYDMVGWIHAARDYEKVHHLAYTALTNYATYSRFKNSPEVDEGFPEYCKETCDKAFQQLKEFIEKRVSERWE